MIRSLLTTLGLRVEHAAAMAKAVLSDGQKTVLIIDDDSDSLRTMRLALEGETYRLETSDTAESALGKVSNLRPDPILLDSRVLTTEGPRLASRLLADEELAYVPIVQLAASGDRSSPEPPGRFDGFIAKPVNPRTLPEQVRGFLVSLWQPPPHPPADLPLPATPILDRRQQAASLLGAIQDGLPDSQFAPATLTGLRRLVAVVGGLEHYELADYLQTRGEAFKCRHRQSSQPLRVGDSPLPGTGTVRSRPGSRLSGTAHRVPRKPEGRSGPSRACAEN
jgi:CheY-like chemotaxis protein